MLDDELHGIQNDSVSDGLKRIAEKEALIARIDAALSTPEPDPMEILRQVREGCFVWDSDSGKLEIGSAMIGFDFTLPDTEATTLIEAYGKQVPRAMLYEINELEDDFPQNIDPKIDEILAKYGYHAE